METKPFLNHFVAHTILMIFEEIIGIKLYISACIGASCAYATPIGMSANTMVLSIDGYKFMAYVKELPLIIASTIVSLILLPLLFPFFP